MDKIDTSAIKKFRILSLDGGGAKGVYTLGVLKEVEATVGKPLCEVFDLIYGTSTGAIIAALLARGDSVDQVLQLYMEHVPSIMKRWMRWSRTRALRSVSEKVFGDTRFGDFKTHVGIVTTNWDHEKPAVFKTDVRLSYGMKATFDPGFGCTVADAVRASCSAYPFFSLQKAKTTNQGIMKLGDGGFCANNPTLYALADALSALGLSRDRVAVLSVGCGEYPAPKFRIYKLLFGWWPSVRLLQKALSSNVGSMEAMQKVHFRDMLIVRVNEAFQRPELSADLLEHDPHKLNLLHQCGRDSFGRSEEAIKKVVL